MDQENLDNILSSYEEGKSSLERPKPYEVVKVVFISAIVIGIILLATLLTILERLFENLRLLFN